MSDQASQVAVGASVERSPRTIVERWLADRESGSFTLGDYHQLLEDVAAVEPDAAAARKLSHAARVLFQPKSGPKPTDAPKWISKIQRMIEGGSPRTEAIKMVAVLVQKPHENLSSVARRLAERLKIIEVEQGLRN